MWIEDYFGLNFTFYSDLQSFIWINFFFSVSREHHGLLSVSLCNVYFSQKRKTKCGDTTLDDITESTRAIVGQLLLLPWVLLRQNDGFVRNYKFQAGLVCFLFTASFFFFFFFASKRGPHLLNMPDPSNYKATFKSPRSKYLEYFCQKPASEWTLRNFKKHFQQLKKDPEALYVKLLLTVKEHSRGIPPSVVRDIDKEIANIDKIKSPAPATTVISKKRSLFINFLILIIGWKSVQHK